MTRLHALTVFALYVLAMLLVGTVEHARAQGLFCTFTWLAPPDNDVAQYRLYEADTPGLYDFTGAHWIAPSPDTMMTTPCIDGHYYVLVAVDTSGNVSAPSNEVVVDTIVNPPADVVSPSPPTGLVVIPQNGPGGSLAIKITSP